MTSRTLPKPRNPFPVRVPFANASDLYPLGRTVYGQAETHLLEYDDTFPHIIRARLHELQRHPAQARVLLDDDPAGLRTALWRAAALIAQDRPQYARYDGGTFRSHLTGIAIDDDLQITHDAQVPFAALGQAIRQHLEALPPLQRLADAVVLSMSADLAVGRKRADDPQDVTEALLVALPSHWNPREKIGLPLRAVHAPIPDAEKLLAASERLVSAIIHKGPFVRYNWSLSSEHWARNPATAPDYAATQAALYALDDPQAVLTRLYFRAERQTFAPLPDLGRYLFFVRTYLHPLGQAAHTPERRETLRAALASFSPEVLAHRHNIRDVQGAVMRALSGTT